MSLITYIIVGLLAWWGFVDLCLKFLPINAPPFNYWRNKKPKMMFRFHRGSLADSIETAMPCNTKKDLIEICSRGFLPVEGLYRGYKIKFYGWDSRVNQHLYMVTVNYACNDQTINGGYCVIGFLYNVDNWVKREAMRHEH